MEKKFLCEHPGCGRSYLRREHLTRHTRVHQKNAFACHLCQKGFSRNDLLTAHLRRHERRGQTAPLPTSPPPASTSNDNAPVTVQLVPNVSECFDSPPIGSSEGSPVTAFSQNAVDTSNRSGAVATATVPGDATLPNLITPQFPLPSAALAQPAMQQDHPMVDASSLPMPPPLSQPSNAMVAAPVGLFYTADAQTNVMATLGPTATVPPSTSLTPFVAQAGAPPLFQPEYHWLFPQTSIFDIPPDDFLDVRLGALQTASPPFYTTPSDHRSSFSVDSVITVTDHQRILNECPQLLNTPLSDFSVTHQLFNSAFEYCDAYLAPFHRPTFDLQLVPAPLLLALCCLGCFVTGNANLGESGQLLQEHVFDRTMVIASNPRVDIWLLQTLLIIEHVCTWSMSRQKHETAEIVHSVVVTLASRNNLMTTAHRPDSDKRQTLETQWREWAQKESVIRLAHAIFVCDVQHMAFLSHQSRLSVNCMKLPLFCPSALWEAPSAWEWHVQMRELRQANKFYPLCSLQSGVEALLMRKEILEPFTGSKPHLNLLIHGIASSIIDLNQRQVVTARTSGTRMLQVADLEECLSLWQKCYGSSFGDAEHHETYSWSALTVYHLSAVLLQTSLDEIQRAAGNAFASGQTISAANARHSYDLLVKTNPVSHESYLHGLEVVTLSLQEPRADSDAPLQPPLWRNYGAFIGVLIIWAYTMKQDQKRKASLASINLSPSLPSSVAANSGGSALRSMYDREQRAPIAESQETKTLQTDFSKLLRLVCERLGASNWEISIEASKILRSLGERTRSLQ